MFKFRNGAALPGPSSDWQSLKMAVRILSCVCQQEWLEKQCVGIVVSHGHGNIAPVAQVPSECLLWYGSGPHRNHGYILAHIRIRGIDRRRVWGAVCATCGVMIAFDDYIYCTCAYPRMRPSQSSHQMESGTQCNQYNTLPFWHTCSATHKQLGSEFKNRVSVSSLKWSNGVRAPISGQTKSVHGSQSWVNGSDRPQIVPTGKSVNSH
jgi:hypothetical protein